MPGSTPIGGCRPRELGSSHVSARLRVGGVAGDVNSRAVGLALSGSRQQRRRNFRLPETNEPGYRPSAIAASSIKLRGRARVDAAFTLALAAYNLIRLPKLLEALEAAIQTTACLIRATRMMVPLFLPVLRRKSIVTGSFPAKASRRSCSMPSRAGWFWSLRS